MGKVKSILILGSNHLASLELTYEKCFNEMGINTNTYGIQEDFLAYYNKSILQKLIYRLGLSLIIPQLQKKVKKLILEYKPTHVLVFKGMEITPKTIIWIKEQGVIVCNYNPDHPFIFSGRGSGNENVTRSITLFDYYFSYADDAVNKLNLLGSQSYKIPFGFDSDGFEYKEMMIENEVLKACFLGNADKKRVEYINKLAHMGLQIDVFGENWNQFKLEKSIKIGEAKYGQAFWDTLQRYALQLNFLRQHNLNTHNMRTFDIPGAGGIMLAPKNLDHSLFFEEDTEVFLFENIEEAFHIARNILKLTFQQRQEIRKKARLKSLIHHTYKQRANDLIKQIEL